MNDSNCRYVTVVYDYDGDVERGLSVKVGEIYFTFDSLTTDWSYLTDGISREGYVPTSYIKETEIDDSVLLDTKGDDVLIDLLDRLEIDVKTDDILLGSHQNVIEDSLKDNNTDINNEDMNSTVIIHSDEETENPVPVIATTTKSIKPEVIKPVIVSTPVVSTPVVSTPVVSTQSINTQKDVQKNENAVESNVISHSGSAVQNALKLFGGRAKPNTTTTISTNTKPVSNPITTTTIKTGNSLTKKPLVSKSAAVVIESKPVKPEISQNLSTIINDEEEEEEEEMNTTYISRSTILSINSTGRVSSDEKFNKTVLTGVPSITQPVEGKRPVVKPPVVPSEPEKAAPSFELPKVEIKEEKPIEAKNVSKQNLEIPSFKGTGMNSSVVDKHVRINSVLDNNTKNTLNNDSMCIGLNSSFTEKRIPQHNRTKTTVKIDKEELAIPQYKGKNITTTTTVNNENKSIFNDKNVRAVSEDATEFELELEKPIPEYFTEEEEALRKKKLIMRKLNELKDYIIVKSIKGKAPIVPCVKVVLGRVLADYHAQSDCEINLYKNEIIEVLKPGQKGWRQGRTTIGKTGYYPDSYVQILKIKEIKEEDIHFIKEGGLFCKALFSYIAPSAKYLSLNKGDRIKITEEEINGWLKGININTRKSGWFPANYCEKD